MSPSRMSSLALFFAALAILAPQVQAKTCPAGDYLDFLTNKCNPCGPGTYTTGKNSDFTCMTAQPGYYVPGSSGGTEELQCPKGQFSHGGATSCTTCPGGSYADEKGTSECHACPAGETSASGSISKSDCTKCPAGTQTSTNGLHVTCSACPPGTFASVPGSTKCCECCEGTYSHDSGSTSCTSCGSGSPFSAAGSTKSGQCKAQPKDQSEPPKSCAQKNADTCPKTTGLKPSHKPKRTKRSDNCLRGHKKCFHYSGVGRFECVDVANDPESCGGCIAPDGVEASAADGRDCTAIPGVSVTRCQKGRCLVEQCRKGWVIGQDVRGQTCVKAKFAHHHQNNSTSSIVDQSMPVVINPSV